MQKKIWLYTFLFRPMAEKAKNDEKALFCYEGVYNKTSGSLIPYFPGKCWGIKLRKMPGSEVTSGEQKLKGTRVIQVRNLGIYRKCEVRVCVHQEPAETVSLPVHFWLSGLASIPQAILIRGNVSSCHIWFGSKCCLVFLNEYSIMTE